MDMSWVILGGSGWMVLAGLGALVLGRAIRLRDRRERPVERLTCSLGCPPSPYARRAPRRAAPGVRMGA